MSVLSRFARSDHGNFAVMFALAMIPVVGAVGAAIDYSRVVQVRSELADALDAGVLAVGGQAKLTDAQALALVKQWVDTHMAHADATWQVDSVTQDADGKITGTASGKVQTTVARVLGIDEVPIGVTSQAVRSLGKIELALVLDNTGSMNTGSKLADLKNAANALVDQLVAVTGNPADLKIALVPFSQTVNAGSAYKTAAWLDTGALSPINDEIFTTASGTAHANRMTLFSQMGVAWGGCVESRKAPYDTTDPAVGAGTPATLYTPYFAVDEPDPAATNKNGNFGNFSNNYLTDGVYSTSNFKIPQGAIAKYVSPPSKTGTNGIGYKYGPNSGCELAPLQRISTNSAAVKTTIGNMVAVGDTNIPFGLIWGWHVLSPSAANGGDGIFGDGLPDTDKQWTKIVVLMTDGQNENTPSGNSDESYYSGIGYIWQNRVGVGAGSTKSQRTTAVDGRLATLCSNMKAAPYNIVIYTVRVEVTTGTSTVLSNCATDSDKFIDVQDSSKLTEVFTNIGGSIQRLRLAQ